MPIYEYRCQRCGSYLEKIQKLSDPALVTCEKCGGHLKRLLSSPAIQFKGSGWYVTDYARRSSASEPGKGEDTSPGEGKEKKEKTVSPEKPAAKPSPEK